MAAITRLGLWGHNTRRTVSFAGKALFVAPVSNPAYLALYDAVVTLLGLANGRVTLATLNDGAVTNVTLRNEK